MPAQPQDRKQKAAKKAGARATDAADFTYMTEAGHRSSARDIAIIASHVVRDFPQQYARYYAIKEYTYNKIRQDNRNLLLRRDATVDGMKTGFTDAAGYCLVASASRDFPTPASPTKTTTEGSPPRARWRSGSSTPTSACWWRSGGRQRWR